MTKKTSANVETLNSGFFSRSRSWLKIIGVATGLLILLILGLILAPQPYYHDGFRTLTELQEYGDTLDEWIKMDGKNLANPSYESYYQKRVSSALVKQIYEKLVFLCSYFGLKNLPTFSVSYFKIILEDVTKKRKNNDLKDDFVQKIEIKESSKIIVFGATQGAFHSLVRDLEKLKELKIIDENLNITSPDFYIIFLGNAINRSPFTLETFTLILKLIQQNLENVIYLKGTNESHDSWKGLTLKRELEIRAQDLSKETIPLETKVNDFFKTLPLSVYCAIPFIKEEAFPYFQLLPSIDDENLRNKLIEPISVDFLKKKSQHKLNSFNLSEITGQSIKDNNVKASLKAIICDIKKRENFEQTDGLRLLPVFSGHVAWTVTSCPTEVYRIAFNFFYDAFVCIEPAPMLYNWHITLYNRNIMIKEIKKFSATTYDFFSGEKMGIKE